MTQTGLLADRIEIFGVLNSQDKNPATQLSELGLFSENRCDTSEKDRGAECLANRPLPYTCWVYVLSAVNHDFCMIWFSEPAYL